MFKELYDVLPPFGQILLTIIVACVGGLAAWQGLRKSSTRQDQDAGFQHVTIPTWAATGPVHEVMQTIHDMAEEARKSNAICADTLRVIERLDRGQDYLLRLVEQTLRNQEMSDDYRPSSSQPRATPVTRHARPQPHPSKET